MVTIDGEIYGEYLLTEKQEISIEGKNILVIEGGEAKITEANCPDKLCTYQKSISKEGESIVCLPNKIVVSIRGGAESDLDSIAG